MKVLLKAIQQPQGHFCLCFTKTLPGNVLSVLPVLYDSRKEKKERLRLRVTSVEKVGAIRPKASRGSSQDLWTPLCRRHRTKVFCSVGRL